jgi:PTH1 family peptidyl-tRNA hydrolase
VIVGIGNPGKRYENNRHNVGFMFLDYMANSSSLKFVPSKDDYYYASGEIENNPFLLIKPSTYVNQSGIAVNQVIEEYKIDLSGMLIILDDINLELGTLRVRASGGDGGHNGMNSIIYYLNSDQFPRIRIGIGQGFSKGEMVDYVLSNFSKEESEILNKSFATCRILTEEFIKGGIKQMLDANSKLLSAENDPEQSMGGDEKSN